MAGENLTAGGSPACQGEERGGEGGGRREQVGRAGGKAQGGRLQVEKREGINHLSVHLCRCHHEPQQHISMRAVNSRDGLQAVWKMHSKKA
jgi:hypothetical protein